MEAIIALFKKAFETLRRFPQLFVFPAICWVVGVLFQNIVGGLLSRAFVSGSGFSFAAYGLAALTGLFIQLIVQLVAAYFSAGQIKGLLLADQGTALTPALFSEAYKKYGNRILSAKLLRSAVIVGIGIVGVLLSLVLSVLGWLVAALAIGVVLLATMFWEYIIVRDDAQVGPALALSRQVVTQNLGPICLPLIAVGLAEAILSSIFGSATAISSLINQVIAAPFAGVILVNLLNQYKAGQTTISG